MVWIILAIIFTILFIVFSLYVKIQLTYIDEDFKVVLKILFLKFKLIPSPTKKPKQKKIKTEKGQKKSSSEKKSKEKKKVKFNDMLDLISVVKQIVEKILHYFNRYLRVDIKALRIKIAADDAAAAAIIYGLVSQSVSYTLEIIRQNVKKLNVKRDDSIVVVTDFIGDKIETQINIIFKLTVWQILVIGVSSFKEFLININK